MTPRAQAEAQGIVARFRHKLPHDTAEGLIVAIAAAIAATEARYREACGPLVAFHNAWVNAEVSRATGNPELVKQLRAELLQAHEAARRTAAILAQTTPQETAAPAEEPKP
jgi:hypothetical protein